MEGRVQADVHDRIPLLLWKLMDGAHKLDACRDVSGEVQTGLCEEVFWEIFETEAAEQMKLV